MPDMKPGHEVCPPPTETTPLPRNLTGPGDEPPRPTTPVPPPPAESGHPTAEAVLGWIAARAGPWFPSAYAQLAGIDRDSLDEPLNELRLAGLVRIAEWVRGSGQGYELTPAGETAAKDPTALTLAREAAARTADGPPETPDEKPAEPDPAISERATGIDLRPPVVTPAMLIANLVWFAVGVVVALQQALPMGTYLAEGNPAVLHRLGAVSGVDLLHGQWWRLVTSCFVHIGLLHLVVNMFALGMMGPLAELLWGRGRLLVIYLVSGLAGSCLAMANHPEALLAGASGAIWGLLASLLAWLLLFRSYLPTDLAADWARRLGLVFLLNAGVSFLPGVSWEAHLGGGVAGFVAAGLLNAIRFGDRWRRRAAVALLVLLPVLCVAGLLAAMRTGDRWVELRHKLATQEEAERAEAERQAINRHIEAYNKHVVPLLRKLSPELVRPVEQDAGFLLLRDPKRRNPELASTALTKVEELRADAAEVATRLVEPTGLETFDTHRQKVKAAAEARAKALQLLANLLTAPDLPDPAALKAWGDAKREADRLWNDIGPR